MKIYFDNQSSQYPIVLLPELALDDLSRDLSDVEIASELGITPPEKKIIKRPSPPLDHKYIENKTTKIEAMGGPPGCLIAVLFAASLFAATAFSEGILETIGYGFLILLFQTTMFAIFGGFSSYEETTNIKIQLSQNEFEKLKKDYDENLKAYYAEINNINQKYKIEYELFKKSLAVNTMVIKNKLFFRHLKPIISASRGITSPKRGFAELRFLEKLDAELKGQIFIDMVPKASWSSNQETYNPDFTFICKETGLHIDIEIDEPYTLKDKTAIHYIDSPDDDRNEFFLDNNWCIIRFTEKQVIQQTDECINTIKSIHESLLNQREFYYSELIPEPRWTYEEAFILQGKGYRERYLRQT